MPKYFFHIRDHDRLIPDETGLDLPDLASACDEARQGAADMLRDALLDGDEISHQVVEITDTAGVVHDRVALSFIVVSEAPA